MRKLTPIGLIPSAAIVLAVAVWNPAAAFAWSAARIALFEIVGRTFLAVAALTLGGYIVIARPLPDPSDRQLRHLYAISMAALGSALVLGLTGPHWQVLGAVGLVVAIAAIIMWWTLRRVDRFLSGRL